VTCTAEDSADLQLFALVSASFTITVIAVAVPGDPDGPGDPDDPDAPATPGAGGLPPTGADPSLPLALAAGLLVAGLGALSIARRRNARRG
jgi:LPXTG-motif cell wall-anchored protein